MCTHCKYTSMSILENTAINLTSSTEKDMRLEVSPLNVSRRSMERKAGSTSEVKLSHIMCSQLYPVPGILLSVHLHPSLENEATHSVEQWASSSQTEQRSEKGKSLTIRITDLMFIPYRSVCHQ